MQMKTSFLFIILCDGRRINTARMSNALLCDYNRWFVWPQPFDSVRRKHARAGKDSFANGTVIVYRTDSLDYWHFVESDSI
jgi:hypothetical protein